MTKTIDNPASTDLSQAQQRSPLSPGHAVLATFGALGLNLLIFAVAKAGGVDFEIPAFGDGTDVTTVNAVQVVVSTLVGLVVGWFVALVAGRMGWPPLRAVAVIGGVVAVTSCATPLTLDASSGVRASLALMHLAAGAVFVAALLNARGVER